MSVPESQVSNKTLLAMKLNIVEIIAIFMLCLLYHNFKGVRKHPQHLHKKVSNMLIIAESFYKVKYGSSIITSKILSKNPSNQNKHLCFCCLQDKTWIEMPKWTIFVLSFLWKHRVLFLHYWDYLTNY